MRGTQLAHIGTSTHDTSHELYASDYYSWCFTQAAMLESNQLERIDGLNIAEEISDLASGQYFALEDALTDFLTLALLYDHGRRPARVVDGLDPTRERVVAFMSAAPSLSARVDEAVREAFEFAKLRILDELDVDEASLPVVCPWAYETIMVRQFFISDGNA